MIVLYGLKNWSNRSVIGVTYKVQEVKGGVMCPSCFTALMICKGHITNHTTTLTSVHTKFYTKMPKILRLEGKRAR